MAKRRSEIEMSDDELGELLGSSRTLYVATINDDGTPHLVPMWFAVVDGDVAFHTYRRSQKVVNLRRDPRLTCLVEAGESYGELRGAQLSGTATLVEDPVEVQRYVAATMRRYDPDLDADEAAARAPSVAAKRLAVVVSVTDVASWDHRKL